MTTKNSRNKKVSVIGLGKLGAPFCAALASRKFTVYGTDINSDLRNTIAAHKAPFYEAQLQDFLASNEKRIKIVNDIDTAVANSTITFIVVATPSEKSGGFSLKYVKQVIQEIGESLKKKNSFHLVVLTSTVLPLSGDQEILPWLEKASGKKRGKDFGFCYNPEFIALGSVIRNLLFPEFVLIGESDKKSGDILERFYNTFCPKKIKIARVNIINTEIAKITLNSYITMKISFANFLAELCEKTVGANVDTVTDILGSDSRIGGKYLKGGLGFGGPCFPRDNRAISYFSKKMGVKAHLAIAADRVNNSQVKRVIRVVEKLISHGSKISILGLSYKPDTAVIEESQAVMTTDVLSRIYKVSVYDPAAMQNSKKILGQKVRYANSVQDCVRGAKVIVLATPWKEFDIVFNSKLVGKSILIDCWRTDASIKLLGKKNYLPLGYFDKRVGI